MPVLEASPALANMTYDQFCGWLSNLYSVSAADIDAYCAAASAYGVSELDAVADLASSYGMNFTKNADGLYSITSFNTIAQDTVTNAVNSNVSTVSRSGFSAMLNRGKDAVTGKLNITRFPASGTFAQQASYWVGSVASAVGAVSAGITLGKTVDSALYNLFPDFFDSHNMATLNPETWNTITTGDDSWQAGLFNFVFGLDPDTGQTQAYMDANAFAYMAMYMNSQGVFDPTTETYDASNYMRDNPTEMYGYSNYFVPYGNHLECYTYRTSGLTFFNHWSWDSTGASSFIFRYGVDNYYLVFYDYQPFTITYKYYNSSGSVTETGTYNSVHDYYNGEDIYYYNHSLSKNDATYTYAYVNDPRQTSYVTVETPYKPQHFQRAILLVTKNVTPTSSGGIEGIGNQSGATLPTTSDWIDIPSTLTSLQQQYPDLFNDALVFDNVQADGSNPQLVYIPVAMPSFNGYNDTQPVSGTNTQANPIIDNTNQPLVEQLMKLLTQSQTEPGSTDSPPPSNPPDTGSGSSPVPVSPTGSASKLWSVYHPTQAQVDAFGSWLWSTNFVDQLLKMFQNPMEGIISLHKVFATPIDAGTGNIIVGTLDSGVSSATITQQYVYVSCGSVNCYEDYGNVFDYSPHTQVSLYLPFIGIVPLDVNDVMRSTITINYGVDMFTGACLAMVEVTRDNDTVNMYQYAGSASVEYPLSNVQQSQLLSGILAVAAGGAAIATGGMSIPAGAAVAGGLANTMKSNIGRSGGFSGNAGAMGIKKPYLIIQRPQTKVAELFPRLSGYPTNISGKLSDFSGQVKVTDVHVEGVPATDVELTQIEELLHSGILV